MPHRHRTPPRPTVVPAQLADARPWDAATRAHLRAQARQQLAPIGHWNHGEGRPQAVTDEVVLDNCAGCALLGWRELPNDDTPPGEVVLPQPNYAGWARIYVQAGRPVPVRWRAALLADLDPDGDNPAYAAALGRDLATWGVNYCEA